MEPTLATLGKATPNVTVMRVEHRAQRVALCSVTLNAQSKLFHLLGPSTTNASPSSIPAAVFQLLWYADLHLLWQLVCSAS